MKSPSNPCRWCVAPDRYPGCHDHCEKLKSYHESDEYKKLCEYNEKYFQRARSTFNQDAYNNIVHKRQHDRKKITNYRSKPWGA